MILDAGVLISFDRNDASAKRLLEALQRTGTSVRTTEAVVAQVWRSGATQVRLARLLREAIVHPLADGRGVGRLLGAVGTSDVVDAHLVLVAAQFGEPVLTSDPDDLRRLAAALGAAAPTIHAWP